MNQEELWENMEEQIKDAINVLQLLMAELTATQEDPHIFRSVSIVEKMLQSILANLQQKKG